MYKSKKFIYFSIASCVLLAITWYSHAILTLLNDPLGLAVDMILYILSIVFKIIIFIIIIIFYFQVMPLLYKNKKLLSYYLLFSFLYSLIFIILLVIFRKNIAGIFNDDVIKIIVFDESGDYSPYLTHYIDKWHRLWKNGLVILLEILVTAVIFLINAFMGYFFGNKRKLIPSICLILNFIILILYNFTFMFAISDYDIFHGDIYSSLLLFDILTFFQPQELYSSISIIFYFNIIFTGIILFSFHKRQFRLTSELI